MKFSVGGKVAIGITAAFVALTVGVIAQGNSGDQRAGPNGYRPVNNSEFNMDTSQHGYDRSLAGRTNAEENRHGTQSQLPE